MLFEWLSCYRAHHARRAFILLTALEPESAVAQAFSAIARRLGCALSVRNLPDPGTAKRSSRLSVLR